MEALARRPNNATLEDNPTSMANLDIEDGSDEERRKRQLEERRRAFLLSRDYARWRRLERLQQSRFKRSVEENKTFFDLLRMVLTTSLLFGLLGFVFKGSAVTTNGEQSFPLTAIPLLVLAAIAMGMTYSAANRFVALMATQFAISNLWAFKMRRGSASAVLYLSLWAVQLFFLFSIACLGWTVAEQSSSKLNAAEPTRHAAPSQ